MNFEIMLDLLIMACGIYMMYWAVQMKSTNKIPPMLVGKGFPINRAKDSNGFIRYTFPLTLTVGVVLLLAGTVGALELFAAYPFAETLMRLALLIILIVYGMLLMRAQKKYLVGM
ncbi:MAG: hypothetical protein K1W16_07300 [Lachnospiraceae bacterium]|jgi:hypothetical protein